MRKVLVVVDVQNDFVDGSLGTAEALLAVPEVCRLIADPSFTDYIVTMDTHGENYPETLEGKNLPVVHCRKDSEGWLLNPEVAEALKEKRFVRIEKASFGSVQLGQFLSRLQPDEIILCGLCTDICVVNNALLLKAFLPETRISVAADACAGTTKQHHFEALNVMKSCQIEIIGGN